MDFWSNGCAKLGQNGLNSLSYHPLLPRPQMDLLMFGEVAQLCRMLLKSVPPPFCVRILHNCATCPSQNSRNLADRRIRRIIACPRFAATNLSMASARRCGLILARQQSHATRT